jgi:hypothetical protein
MVKVIPNRAMVDAKIKNIKKTQEPNIFQASIEILSSEPVEGYTDFANRFVGRTVEAKLLARESDNIALNKPIKLAIRYEGDERGGSFFAQEQADKMIDST